MTIVCVDDHSLMLNGTKKSVEQILPDASIFAFTDAFLGISMTNNQRMGNIYKYGTHQKEYPAEITKDVTALSIM